MKKPVSTKRNLSAIEMRMLAKCEVARRFATLATTRERVSSSLALIAYGAVPKQHDVIAKLYALGLITWANGTHTTEAGRAIIGKVAE